MREYTPEIVGTGDGDDFAATATRIVWRALEEAGDDFVTLPTGTTPLGVYRRLAAGYGDRRTVWDRIRYLALDEYAGLTPGDERLFANWIDRALLGPVGMPASARLLFRSDAPDPAQEAAAMEDRIAAGGRVFALAVLGLGGNGHLAFNEPGSAFDSRTRLVELAPESRQANAAYWGGLEAVPARAFTLGLGTLGMARRIILLVSGAAKADILSRTLNGRIDPAVPATFLRTIPRVTIIADRAALRAQAPEKQKASS